jgi:dUTP pyrophosphatase
VHHDDSVPVLAVGEPPRFAHPGDAGADLSANSDYVLGPGERAVIGTGVKVALPAGYMALVLPRSGLAARHGITLVNSPGLIDSGYRGEISVVVLNTDKDQEFRISAGDRIAQLVVMPVTSWHTIPVEALPGSHRGDNGFGSTGVKRKG